MRSSRSSIRSLDRTKKIYTRRFEKGKSFRINLMTMYEAKIHVAFGGFAATVRSCQQCIRSLKLLLDSNLGNASNEDASFRSRGWVIGQGSPYDPCSDLGCSSCLNVCPRTTLRSCGSCCSSSLLLSLPGRLDLGCFQPQKKLLVM